VGGGFGDAVGVGAVVFAGDGAAGVAVGLVEGVDGVGVLITLGLTTAGLTTPGLEAAGLVTGESEAGASVDTAAEVAGWLLGAGNWLPEAAGWLLVQAASVPAVATATSHRVIVLGPAGIVGPRRRIWPG
jgi:hypothetical protein